MSREYSTGDVADQHGPFPFAMSMSPYFLISALSGFVILSLMVSGDLMQGSFGALVVGGSLCVAAAVLVWKRDTIIIAPPSTFLIGILLVVVSCVSAWRIGFTQNAVFGSGLEWGTVASFILFSVSFFIGSMVSRRVIPLFLWSVEMAGVAGACVVAGITLGLVPATVVASSWIQLSFIFCAAVLVAAARMDAETKTGWRIAHSAVALMSFGAFIMLFVPEAAAVAIVSALVVAYAASRSAQERFPYASVVLALTLLALLVFGMRAPVLSLSDDARPSLHATSFVTGPEFMDSAADSLVGTGPRTFSYLWDTHRTIEENATPLWRFTPKYSYSALSTVTLEEGLLGMFAFLIFLMIPMIYILKRSRTDDPVALSAAGALSVCALFLMLSTFVSPLGLPVLLITALIVGMCAPYDASTGVSITARYWIFAMAACAFLIGASFIYISYRQLSAARFDRQGLALMSSGDAEHALPFLTRAIDLWETSEYDEDIASAYLKAGLSEQKSGSLVTAQQHIDTAATFAGRAIQVEGHNFSRALFSASLYFTLMQHGVAGADGKVRDALDHAAALSPTRPEVPYARALLALAQGNTKEALAQLDKAIALKPDYEEALKLRIKITPVQ